MMRHGPRKIELIDPRDRVSRLLHRSTPGGELILLDLRHGFRGEFWSEPYSGGMEIRCKRFSNFYESARWDPADESYLVRLKWRRRHNEVVLHKWSKGTCEILLAPLRQWMPMQSKRWTCLKEIE